MEHNNEIKAVIERVKIQFKKFYNGDPWATENFNQKVLSIKQDEALRKIQGHSHSVAELVRHMIAWRNFAVQKLTGNDSYDIEDESTVNWPEPTDWADTCKEFELCHQNLLSAIETLPLERWNATVPGRNYSFIYLVHGIIEHDYYHYGQIGSLMAGIRKMQAM